MDLSPTLMAKKDLDGIVNGSILIKIHDRLLYNFQ